MHEFICKSCNKSVVIVHDPEPDGRCLTCRWLETHVAEEDREIVREYLEKLDERHPIQWQ